MALTISPVEPSSGVIFFDPGNSLDQRMIGELGKLSEDAANRQSSLTAALEGAASNPSQLLKAQVELATFHTDMSLRSTLARKAVAVVETLVKS